MKTVFEMGGMGVSDIPLRLRRVFLGSFGSRPRPLQERAYQVLQRRQDGLIIAPTGMGKTEAALIPVARRILEVRGGESSEGRLRALIISPTRALATDLHKRLSSRFAELDLRLDVATGDRDTRSTVVPSDLLIRTPEGLDSLICRQADLLAGLEEVVIDEIHYFLPDPRGTQLVGLLDRLSEIVPNHRRIGVSATVSDETVPARMGFLRDEVQVIDIEDRGEIEFVQHRWVGKKEQGVRAILTRLRELGSHKSIGFVRTRARAEEVVALLDTGFLRGRCFVHHAGTSVSIRRRTEQALRSAPVALVVATTTLEVGIDIGNVDTCILFDAPPDASSLLQRAGRSGRRDGLRRVLYVTGLYDRGIAFSRLIAEAKRASRVGRTDIRPFLSGCLQQAVSFVASVSSTPRTEVVQFLERAYKLTETVGQAIITCLVDEGLLLEAGEYSLELSPQSQRMLENRSLHLTFSSGGGTPIVDERTRRRIGRAVVDTTGTVRLGGEGRRVTGVDPRTGHVLTRPVDGGEPSFAQPGPSRFEAVAGRHMARMGGLVRVAR